LNRVAVTGLGLVCALGNRVGECWPLIRRGESRIRPLTDPGTPPFRFAHGAEAVSFRAEDHFDPKDLLLLERFALMATVAAREAVAQSGIVFKGELADRSGVITGTSVGGQFSEEEGYKRLYQEKQPRVAPLTIPRTMSNAGASRISLEFGIHGPSYTISTACSSSNHSIGQAFWMVRSGQLTAAIAGGSEAVFAEGFLRAWEAMRVVSPEPCQPFSPERRGLSLGEGGGMLVLENWQHAQARGAVILGEILGFGMSSDAHHITQPCIDGPANAMNWALRDAEVKPEAIDYINAHGTGTQANDSTESQAIRRVFGAKTDSLPVSSTKAIHGHTLGAAGAVEAVVTLLALQNGVVPPTANTTSVDETCPIRVIHTEPLETPLELAMSNTFAFGGLNASLVMRRFGI
jgi:nodulation protein E